MVSYIRRNEIMNELITFANENSINVDQLYVDRFWSSLYDDKWIYIDSEIVQWIGYDDQHVKEGKNYILKKLRASFRESVDFKLIKLEEVDECDYIPSIDFDTIHASKLLIVELDTFKELLLSMNTPKARQVQKYFIQVEKLCRKYMHSQRNINTLQINRMKLEANECVYIISNNRNAKMHLYKIGKTKNLKARISSLNTSNPDRVNDRLRAFAVIKTFDCKSLEEMIHAHLDAYRHSDSKEWFQIEYSKLQKVIEHFKIVAEANIRVINELDDAKVVAPQIEYLSAKRAIDASTQEEKQSVSTCPNCKRTYKFANDFFQRHIQFCK